ERDLALTPDQPEDLLASGVGPPVPMQRDGFAGKRIAVTVHGADELGRPGSVADRLADLGDERRQVDVRDHRVGPEPAVELGFGKGAGPRLEKDLEQLERLR